jgi:hypothetical protein
VSGGHHLKTCPCLPVAFFDNNRAGGPNVGTFRLTLFYYVTATIRKFFPAFPKNLLHPTLQYENKVNLPPSLSTSSWRRTGEVDSNLHEFYSSALHRTLTDQIFINAEWARWGYRRSWPSSMYYPLVNLQRLKKHKALRTDSTMTTISPCYRLNVSLMCYLYHEPVADWTLRPCQAALGHTRNQVSDVKFSPNLYTKYTT